jgi:hypothetical protein
MFITFIETAVEKFLNVEIRKFVDAATCCYQWQHVAANSNEAVV